MEKESEFLLLTSLNTLIQKTPDASQRDISKSVNMSLGMTNSLLKRFAEKGWILMKRISPKNVQYVLTPEGIHELAERNYHYLKRTMKTVINYKDAIIDIVKKAKETGCISVMLVGSSDLDFIIEYASQLNGMPFIHEENLSSISDNRTGLVFLSEKQNCDAFTEKNDIRTVPLIDVITAEPV